MAEIFDEHGLAVSLPAGEVAKLSLSGSLFSAADLAAAPVSPGLLRAVQLVEAASAKRGGRLVFIARPEVFTDPVTLGWLGERLHGIGNHLCITDGGAVRVLPGLRNHMFFYQPGLHANAEAFGRLCWRAPELIAGLGVQINSAARVQLGETSVGPASQLLMPQTGAAADPAELFGFCITPGPAERAASWMLARGPVDPAPLTGFARAAYLPLTETALSEPVFCDAAADHVAATFFDPAACLLLRLPELASGNTTLADRLAFAVARLSRGRVALPRVPAGNIFFLTGDPDPALLDGLGAAPALTLPGSFDFWRHPTAFYSRFASIAVLGLAARRRAYGPLATLLTKALGRKPELRWLKSDHDEHA